MSCFYPVKIWVLFPHLRGQALQSVLHQPVFASKAIGDMYVEKTRPCGICIECKLKKSVYTATRCVHESKMHDNNAFLTLTYSDENLPGPHHQKMNDGTIKYFADLSLCTDDLQKFWKKYRKHLGEQKIKYYASGEYGDGGGDRLINPHYHAIVFGHDFPDKEYYKKNENGDILYTSPTLTKMWGHGHAVLGDVTFESAAYVARYTLKKIYGDDAIEHYNGRMPERSWSSQGLAESWFEKYGSDVYPRDEIILSGGRRLSPPPYYDKLLLKYDPDKYAELLNKRAEYKINNKINNFALDRFYENGNPRVRTVSDSVRRAALRVGSVDKYR